MKEIAKVLGLIALSCVGAVWFGYVAATLWGWFVVPLGAPAVSWASAYGISLCGFLFFGSKTHFSDRKQHTLTGDLVNAAGWWFAYALALGIGRITLYFV